MLKIIILFVILLLISVIAALSNLPLCVRHEELGGDIKAAHISDIHKRKFGKNNRHLIEKTAAEKPDIIVISGDFVSRTETDFSCAEATLNALCSIAPVYMCFGNHEQSLPENEQKTLIDTIAKTDVILLRNTSSQLNVRGRKITFFGLEESYDTYKKDDSYRNLDTIGISQLEALLGSRSGGEVFLIAHNPFFAQAYSQWGADIVFSGHVHGGAVRIFGKGILSPERNFFPKYSKGVYTVGKTKLLVSAGLGKLRLFNPPEIVIYKL